MILDIVFKLEELYPDFVKINFFLLSKIIN
jgi:hypothetical protein